MLWDTIDPCLNLCQLMLNFVATGEYFNINLIFWGEGAQNIEEWLFSKHLSSGSIRIRSQSKCCRASTFWMFVIFLLYSLHKECHMQKGGGGGGECHRSCYKRPARHHYIELPMQAIQKDKLRTWVTWGASPSFPTHPPSWTFCFIFSPSLFQKLNYLPVSSEHCCWVPFRGSLFQAFRLWQIARRIGERCKE